MTLTSRPSLDEVYLVWETRLVAPRTATEVDAERVISKALFGSAHMLAVITAIASTETSEFTAPQIEELTGLGASTVHYVISRLLQAHVVYRTGSTSTDRVVRYVRRDTDLLDAIANARHAR